MGIKNFLNFAVIYIVPIIALILTFVQLLWEKREISIGYLFRVVNPENKTDLKLYNIRLFNNGVKALRREDFYGGDFEIKFNGFVGDVKIIKQRFSTGNFKIVKKDSDRYSLSFDFFNPEQVIDICFVSNNMNFKLLCSAADVISIKTMTWLDRFFPIWYFIIIAVLYIPMIILSFHSSNVFYIVMVSVIVFIGMLQFVKLIIDYIKIPRYVFSFPTFKANESLKLGDINEKQ